LFITIDPVFGLWGWLFSVAHNGQKLGVIFVSTTAGKGTVEEVRPTKEAMLERRFLLLNKMNLGGLLTW
jgi:hypothetical protein